MSAPKAPRSPPPKARRSPPKTRRPPTAPAPASTSPWDLLLYVAGATPKSVAALRNLELLCETHLAGSYRIQVIDLMKHPQLAQSDQILAVPTLVRKLPSPVRKIIGTLSDTERVILGLDLSMRERDTSRHPEKGKQP